MVRQAKAGPVVIGDIFAVVSIIMLVILAVRWGITE